MIIDFEKIEKSTIKKFKNGLGEINAQMFFDGTNRIMVAQIEKGNSIGYHKHETNSEIIYVLEGKATLNIEGELEYVEKGQIHYCKKGYSHSLINEQNETLKVLCIVPEQ